MDQLTYKYRMSFMESHQYPISEIPTVCFASNARNALSALRPFQLYILSRYDVRTTLRHFGNLLCISFDFLSPFLFFAFILTLRSLPTTDQAPNDGMVCVSDAILPGSKSVVVGEWSGWYPSSAKDLQSVSEGLDHAEMVIATSPNTVYSKTRFVLLSDEECVLKSFSQSHWCFVVYFDWSNSSQETRGTCSLISFCGALERILFKSNLDLFKQYFSVMCRSISSMRGFP